MNSNEEKIKEIRQEALDSGRNQRFERRRRNFRQVIGIFAGGFAALMISTAFPVIEQKMGRFDVVMWGAVIGGIIATYKQFERAGYALTRRENPTLNYTLGIGIPLLLVLVAILLLN